MYVSSLVFFVILYNLKNRTPQRIQILPTRNESVQFHKRSIFSLITDVVSSEVVLSILIESFKFSPSDKEIFWQMNSIATPTVVGGNGKNELPLRVSKV
jgi:hypothetical protein